MKKIVSFIFVFLMLASFSEAIGNNSIVYWYSMENTSNTNHTNHINPTMTGTPTSVSGKVGNALDFDSGTDHYALNWGLNTLTTTYSVNTWVYLDSVPTSTNYILNNNGAYFSIEYTATQFKCGLFTSVQRYAIASVDSTLGNWQMITCVYSPDSGGTIKIYVNASLQQTQTVQGTSLNAGDMKQPSYLSGTFDGKLDEVAYWKGLQLTATNISDLYNAGNGIQYPESSAVVTNVVLVNVTSINNSIFLNATRNYTRQLDYNVSYTCDAGVTYLNVITENSTSGLYLYQQTLLSCDSTGKGFNGSVIFPSEGKYNVTFNYSESANQTSNNISTWLFNVDLYNPTAKYWINDSSGFNILMLNNTLICEDNIFSKPLYNFTFNAVQMTLHNYTNATMVVRNTSFVQGNNQGKLRCSDPFGYTENTTNIYMSFYSLYLIDETTNDYFDVSNVTNVTVYINSNSSFYSFTSHGNVSWVNFSSALSSQIRVEFRYPNGIIITRYVDTSISSTSEIRICGDKAGSSFAEQIPYSTSLRPVMIKNVFANCVVLMDYTRFAYQVGYRMAKAYTIPSRYYMYIFENGTAQYLISIDGSVADDHLIDSLIFSNKTYDFSILGDALSFYRVGNDLLRVVYQNDENNNANATLYLTRMRDSVVLDSEVFTDPNNFDGYFNITGWFVNATDIVALRIDKVDTDGRESSLTRYFNEFAQSGKLPSQVAFTIAMLLILFGLTFTVSKLTFSWFGIIMELSALAVCAFAVWTWYITALMGLNIVILIYTVLILTKTNYRSVS